MAVEPVDTKIMSPMFTASPDRQPNLEAISPMDFCTNKRTTKKAEKISEKSSKDATIQQLKNTTINFENIDYTDQLLERISSLEKCIQEKDDILGVMKKEKLENHKEILFLKNQNQFVVSHSNNKLVGNDCESS